MDSTSTIIDQPNSHAIHNRRRQRQPSQVPHEPFKCCTQIIVNNGNHVTPPLPQGVRRGRTVSGAESVATSSAPVSSSTCHIHKTPQKLVAYEVDLHNSSTKAFDALRSNCKGTQSVSTRPVCAVQPLQEPRVSAGVQTDALSIDLNAILHIRDAERSQRTVGLLQQRVSSNDSLDNASLASIDVNKSLEQQIAVNADLKRLLVASIGDDLARRLENLSMENKRLQNEAGDLRSRLTDTADQLDKAAIEADMWRSKFFAGRLMLDELAGWKAQLSVRYQEAMAAVHALLQERHQIRTDMAQTLMKLGALVPSRICSTLHITNSVELSVACRQLSSSLKPSANKSGTPEVQGLLQHCRGYTQGEALAAEALANRPNLAADQTGRYTAAYRSPASISCEQMALDTCGKCTGDVLVL